MRWRRRAALFLLIAGSSNAGSSSLHAGGRQQAAPPQTFRSGTQIVQVDVRVLKDGHFVTGLGPADFTIREDGVAQKIESVALVGAPAASAAAAPTSAPGASAAAPAPSVWLFVFDTGHLSPGGLTRARDAVVKFIGERFKNGDLGAVVADGRMANNRISSDREELERAAAAVKATGNESLRMRQQAQEWPRIRDAAEAFDIANNNGQALTVALQRACNDDPPMCRRAPPDMELMEKARDMTAAYKETSRLTLNVVAGLATGLARIPGQKTIVFFSEGFVVQQQEAELRSAIGQAARAGARFYTIDARGLHSGNAAAVDQKQVDSTIGGMGNIDLISDGPISLAVDTGGFAIRNENNFGRALEEIQRDAATYYVVSYVPTNTTFDGKYRAVGVSVDRPGVQVRARRGYLALEPAALLRTSSAPAPGSGARVPTNAASASEPAASDRVPEPPVSPGSVPVSGTAPPAVSSPAVATPASTRADAVRSRVEDGKMVAALGRSAAIADSAADRGWSAYQKGDVAAAASALHEAATAPDARPWVHYALGLAEFAQQHYKEAASAWGRVLRDVPEFEPIYFSLADAYGLQHDEGAAIKVLREAERRWPSDPEVFDALGVIQVRRGALDAAIDSFDRATEVAPADALGYFNLGRTLQMRLLKSQRYDPQLQKWVGGDDDRKRAAASFQKYLDLGGPYESQAREALSALSWR